MPKQRSGKVSVRIDQRKGDALINQLADKIGKRV